MTEGAEAFSLTGGFWPEAPLTPTAASAAISGRVVDRNGRGVSMVAVYLSGGTFTQPRVVSTNALGRFVFEGVRVGQFYVLSVSDRRRSFSPDHLIFDLSDDLNDVEFIVNEIPN